MKTKLSTIICLTLCLLLCSAAAFAADHSTMATIDLIFDEMTFTDSVQVEWNTKYPVPEGGVKWDGTEDFIGYANKDNWKIINLDEFSYGEGQIAFMAKRGISFFEIEQLAAKHGARIVAYLALTDDYVIELINDKSLSNMRDVIESLKSESSLISETVTPHYAEIYGLNRIPDDPWYEGVAWTEQPSGKNWNMEAIHAVEAWDYLPFMTERRIAIIDTIFDDNHEDIPFAVIRDLNTASYNEDLEHSGSGHGTHVAGIALAIHDNKTGISGVFPKGKAVAIGVLGENSKQKATWAIDEKDYILRAIINDANVINISLGYDYEKLLANRDDPEEINRVVSLAFQRIISDKTVTFRNYLGESETYTFQSRMPSLNQFFNMFPTLQAELGDKYCFDFLLVCSAGNNGIDAQYNFWPQAISSDYFRSRLVTVGSTMLRDGNLSIYYEYDKNNRLIEFNWGRNVSIVAPGWNVYSSIYDNKYESWPGTSMSAPHVTGVAAMIWSINPELTGPEVKEILLSSSDLRLTDRRGYVYPALDALACVEVAFKKASGNGTLRLTATKEDTNEYIYDVQVSIKPLKICQETNTANANTGVVYPYIKPLKLGQYEVTVSKDGYHSHTEIITVTRDSTIDLNVSLKPTDAPQITKGTLNGAVTLNSNGVSGIEVNVLSGANHVMTLITNEAGQFATDLEPGAYVLSIDADGYVPVSKNTTVFVGKTTTENIELDDSMYATVKLSIVDYLNNYHIKIHNARGSVAQIDFKLTLVYNTVLYDTAQGIINGSQRETDGFRFVLDDELIQGSELVVTSTDGNGRHYEGSIILGAAWRDGQSATLIAR